MAPQPSLRTVALGWLSLSAGLTTARSVSHQSPTRNDDTAVPQKPVLSHQGSQHPKQPPRNATITLYPGSFDPTRQGSCSPSQPSETVSLAADTCLSGDYYLSTNVELVSAPVCHDGHPPYMAVFPRRACTGPRTWYDYGRTELPTCLDVDKWPLRAGRSEVHDLSWSHWSVMFYCNDLEAAMKADGAPRHVTAHPPDLRSGAGVRDFKAGRVEVYATEDACRRGMSVKEELLEPGVHFNLPAYVDHGTAWVRVTKPAYCLDGSRAQLAMYGDVSCDSHHHGGTHDHDAEILDITDAEGDRCVEARKYSAVAFSCARGIRLPGPKGRAAQSGGYRSWLTVVFLAILLVGAVFLAAVPVALGFGEMLRLLVSRLLPS